MTEPTESVDRRAVLRTTGALLAAGAGAGSVAAANGKRKRRSGSTSKTCFPPKLAVEVKPGNGGATDPINPRSRGTIPVAVLQTQSFDPTARTIDYRFDAAGEVGCDSAQPLHGGHVEDVDGDGKDDLVLHFDAQETNFGPGDQAAELLWVETHGTGKGTCTCKGLSGTDEVRIVGKR